MNLNKILDNANDSELTLDDLLLSLQNSFNSVSQVSQKIPKEHARSIIYGDIDFTLELQAEGNRNKILVTKNGSLKLSLSGKINMDTRVEASDI